MITIEDMHTIRNCLNMFVRKMNYKQLTTFKQDINYRIDREIKLRDMKRCKND